MYWILGTVILGLFTYLVLLFKEIKDAKVRADRSLRERSDIYCLYEDIMCKIQRGLPIFIHDTIYCSVIITEASDDKLLIKKIQSLYFENKLQNELKSPFEKVLSKIRNNNGIN